MLSNIGELIMTTLNIKLSTIDPFAVEGAKEVNLDDNREFRYTFWRRDKKKTYAIPNFFMSEALDRKSTRLNSSHRS